MSESGGIRVGNRNWKKNIGVFVRIIGSSGTHGFVLFCFYVSFVKIM